MTYLYTIHFKKDGILRHDNVRAKNKIDACREISRIYGDVTIVDVRLP